jgi:hypothetical protein
LDRFEDDYRTFRHFQDGCLVRLLNDEGARGYGYYRKQIDFTTRRPFARNYGDYFAGRIVFPIRNAASEVIGFIGRRPDNKGIRWLKQQAGESAITTKSWLYGIDKAYRFIKHYRTVILWKASSTISPSIGCCRTRTAGGGVHSGFISFRRGDGHFQTTGVEHFIVAYDWDAAGRRRPSTDRGPDGRHGLLPRRDATRPGPGGKAEGRDRLHQRFFTQAPDGFSKETSTSIGKTHPHVVHFLRAGGKRECGFSPAEAEAAAWHPDETDATEYYYDVADFLPLLSYDHGNKAMLDQTINEITKLLEARHTEPQSDTAFTIPVKFLQTEAYTDLGPALILWLRLVIEQQAKKRKVRQTDAVWLSGCIRPGRTITTYKRSLHELGYLKIDTSHDHSDYPFGTFPSEVHSSPSASTHLYRYRCHQ